MEGFIQEKIDFGRYEISFRRWLVMEVESGRMTLKSATERFKFPGRFEKVYKAWQMKYSNEIIVTLQSMTAEERIQFKEQEARIKELEAKLDHAQLKNLAIETLIDVAEKDYKLSIRKKAGSKR